MFKKRQYGSLTCLVVARKEEKRKTGVCNNFIRGGEGRKRGYTFLAIRGCGSGCDQPPGGGKRRLLDGQGNKYRGTAVANERKAVLEQGGHGEEGGGAYTQMHSRSVGYTTTEAGRGLPRCFFHLNRQMGLRILNRGERRSGGG